MDYVNHLILLSPMKVSLNNVAEKASRHMLTHDDWLTVHRSITLVDLQLDAQNSYLFTYNTFIKILYMFRALLCFFLTGAQDSHLHRVTIPEAAYIELLRRPPEDEQSNAQNM
jgi:hypothetical protein